MRAHLVDLIHLLAAPRCPGCDERVSPGVALCVACEGVVEPSPSPPPAARAALFLYGGPIKDGVLRMKRAGRSDVADRFGALLARAATPFVGDVDVVVPVPSHRARLVERGFDVPALLARPVARRLDVPLAVDGLRRVRRTDRMGGLDARARAANVRGAFEGRPARLAGRRVLLVDDVKTTGVTLAEAATAARAAGARAVLALALAEAAGPGP